MTHGMRVNNKGQVPWQHQSHAV